MESNDSLNIMLKFSADATAAKKDIGELAKAVKETEKAVKAIDFRDLAQKIGKVGQQLTNTGKGLSSMLMGAASAYISSAGQFDARVQKWNAAQREIQAAYARIGAVSLETLTPYLEKAATVVDKLADFVEKNPWIIKAAAGTAATLMMAGSLAGTASTLMNLKGSLDGVAKMLGITGPGMISMVNKLAPMIGKAGFYGATTGLSLWAGGNIGKFTGNVINQATGQKQQSWEDIAETARKAGAIPLMLIGKGLRDAGFEDAAKNVLGLKDSVMELGKSTETVADQVLAAVGANKTFVDENVQMFIDYQKELADAQQSYEDEVKVLEKSTADARIQILEDFGQRARSAEAAYISSRNTLVSNYETSQAQAIQDFYAAQAAAQRAFNLEMRRLAEDHKLRLRKLEQEHNAKVADLVASRDALGLAKEQADYKRAVSEENAAYKLERQRRAENHQLQMAEMARNFAIEQERRRQEFEQQLAEKAAAFAAEQEQNRKDRDEALKALEDHNKETLKKMKDAYDKQTRMMQTNFVDRLNAMSQSISGNTAAWISYMQNQATDFQNWLNTIYASADSAGATGIARAAGGGVLSGKTYLVGENGPELFTARNSGRIIPAGMTARMLSGSAGGSGAKNITVKIEGRGLTMREVMSEMDSRFGVFEKRLVKAFR